MTGLSLKGKNNCHKGVLLLQVMTDHNKRRVKRRCYHAVLLLQVMTGSYLKDKPLSDAVDHRKVDLLEGA